MAYTISVQRIFVEGLKTSAIETIPPCKYETRL